MTDIAPLHPLPHNTQGEAWPAPDWSQGPLEAGVDQANLQRLLDFAFSETVPEALGETHAFVAVHRGQLVAERYWRDYKASDTYPSWSMAKSITHALVGILVDQGKIDINAPADVPEWQGADDPRRLITLDQLLRMSSGLAFAEDYVDSGVSDVIEMLFGKGKADVAAYAAGRPVAHAPDTVWNYSSGTTNIVARCAARALGKSGEGFEAFMRSALLDKIGMHSAKPKFDEAGTFIGSSFCYCTARDFAKFGLLYMRDGRWNDEQILPKGWADYARTPTPTPDDEPMGYGAHWWLGICGPDSFSANGYQGQYTVVVPSLDLILVRHGNSDAVLGEDLRGWITDVANCFRAD